MTELDLLNLLVAFVAPVLVGLLAKATWPPGVKATLLLALASATALVQKVVDAGGSAGFDWRGAIMAAGVTFLMAVAAHFGLWRPVGVAAWAARNGNTDDYPLAA